MEFTEKSFAVQSKSITLTGYIYQTILSHYENAPIQYTTIVFRPRTKYQLQNYNDSNILLYILIVGTCLNHIGDAALTSIPTVYVLDRKYETLYTPLSFTRGISEVINYPGIDLSSIYEISMQ